MNQVYVDVNNQLKPFLKTVVGYIKVNESWVHHNNSYECAAWWEDSKIQQGVYAMTLERSNYAPFNLYLGVKLDAIVTEDFFPALWGGVGVNKTYVPQNIGAKRVINHCIDLLEAVENTGKSPGNKVDMCINPLIISGIIGSARQSLINHQNAFNERWVDYSMEGDGKYDTNLRMIAYHSANMSALCEAIEKMSNKLKDLTSASDYMRANYIQNTAWAFSG